MGFYDAIRIGASGAADTTYTVDRSLRFNDNDSAYLNRTPSNGGDRRVFTLSWWIKLGNSANSTSTFTIFSAQRSTLNPSLEIRLQENRLVIVGNKDGSSSSYMFSLVTEQLFRDPSAWYHFVVAFNTSDSTASNRIKIYVNGSQITSFSAGSTGLTADTYPSSGDQTSWGTNEAEQQIGRKFGGSAYFDGYLAEINVVDGSQLAPSSFGETDSTTGQWIPKKYTGSYGNSDNGYYLNFSDNSGTTATTLGKDSSGNSNNFTPNNFSVTAGEGNDSLEDTPTNNFCTLNPLEATTCTYSNGNLNFSSLGNGKGARGTFFVSSGKWYFEYTISSGTNAPSYAGVGIQRASGTLAQGKADDGYSFFGFPWKTDDNGTTTNYWANSWSFGDVIGVAFDLDNRDIYLYKNGSLESGAAAFTNITAGSYAPFIGNGTSSNANHAGFLNFGQRAFIHTPPTGFKALCSANLPDPTILLPNKHFDTLLWSGNSSTQAITGLSFSPDWVWSKRRSASSSHYLNDTVRGAHKIVFSEQSAAEYDGTSNNDGVDSFDSNGFTFQNGTYVADYNASGSTYVGWSWNAGDTDGKTYTVKAVSDGGNKYRFDDFGTSAVTLDLAEGGTYIFDQSDSSNAGHPLRFSTTADGTHGGGSEYTTGVTVTGTAGSSGAKTTIVVAASAPNLAYYCTNHSGMGGSVNTNSTLGSSNFDGSVQSIVKANPTAGMSITRYTGTGSALTVGHGLGVAPDVLIVKNREEASSWRVFHHKNTSAPETEYLALDTNNATFDRNDWNDTLPTSTVFSVGQQGAVNNNNIDYIGYIFSEVAGYSKFGSYTGNGNADGTFIFTGFRPAWVLIKNSGASGFDWVLQDATRSPFNVANEKLNPNTSAAAQTGNDRIDMLSNGFKCRDSSAGINADGSSYIYLAFAEAPFRNARAR